MEILKSFIPSWMNSELQPFLTSPQDGITMPTWNKMQWSPEVFGSSGTGNAPTIRGIMVVDGVARYVDFVGTIGGPV